MIDMTLDAYDALEFYIETSGRPWMGWVVVISAGYLFVRIVM